MTNQPKPNQRYVSQAEPELGLGIIVEVAAGLVKVWFRAARERRQYALATAPLRRVQLQVGDKVTLQNGAEIVVERVSEHAEFFTYHAAGQAYPETELADALSFSKPEARLLAGRVDENVVYDLRLEALYRRAQMRSSPARGFVGGRVELIPHQLAIAHTVTERLRPRVLLADEVGLGKTIEAGLILHRLHRTGRAERILVLVPEALVHQWFVEMLRKFNLRFRVVDEAHCEAVELHQEATNPFAESTLIVASVTYLAQTPERAQQAMAAGWDLLVVDEAHHLAWTPDAPSAEYTLVKTLAEATPGLILLTATPQQLGLEGHFARLHLLDPERYPELEAYRSETARYARVAQGVARLQEQKNLTKADLALFSEQSPHVRALATALAQGKPEARAELIQALLDECGLGRVVFRNTRRKLRGFPERKLHLVPLEGEADLLTLQTQWLVKLLKALPQAKILLIVSARETVEALQASLQEAMQVNSAMFHEGLTLLQRDRQAAYFAETDGARLLLCSEIGSEGRNFQFAHHLVLMDLPRNPELLEQRIGRLDRIGQKETIHLHVPFLPNTDQAVLARWYHEGLDAFQENLPGGQEIALALDEALSRALDEPENAVVIQKLLKASKAAKDRVTAQLAAGEDRLLELSAPVGEPEILPLLRQLDADVNFESFLLRLGDHCGLVREELGPRTYVWHPGHLVTDSLPAMPADGLTVTFDRSQAVIREDWDFLTWDHPVALGALDYLLGSEPGNAACVHWTNASKQGLWLETIFVAECIAPAAWQVDRFLPATPVRVVVAHTGEDWSQDRDLVRAKFQDAEIERLLEINGIKDTLLPKLLEQARELAAQKLPRLIKAAQKRLNQQLDGEIARLESLRQKGNHVNSEEIQQLTAHRNVLAETLANAQLRLDATRVIQSS